MNSDKKIKMWQALFCLNIAFGVKNLLWAIFVGNTGHYLLLSGSSFLAVLALWGSAQYEKSVEKQIAQRKSQFNALVKKLERKF
jgi:hypothetical protein